MTTARPPRRRPKWWLLAVLGLLTAAFAAWNWGLRPGGSAQDRVVAAQTAAVVVGAGLLLWLAFAAGLTARGRWRVFGALGGMGLAGLALLDLRGFSGDLMPILRWRFGSQAAAALPTATPTGRTATPRGAQGDYPQFLGPHRDATVRGAGLARDWNVQPPTVVWRQEIGAGWSGFAVAGGTAFTLEQRGPHEAVVAYDVATGAVRWVHADEARFESRLAGPGPRSTPTVIGDRVYAVGATGLLNCLDRGSGQRLWSQSTFADGSQPKWGVSTSPLLVDDLVVVAAGGDRQGMLAAFAAGDGAPRWRAGRGRASYASPRLATLAGVRQLLMVSGGAIAGHAIGDGEPLWEVPWNGRTPNVADALALPGDRVLVSSGYGVGSVLLQIEPGGEGELRAAQVWRSRRLKAKFANPVHREGYVYGLDDGILACLDVATGKRQWKGGRYGHGQVILADDLLLITAEDGALVLVEATPTEHRELARAPALSTKTWNTAALVAPYLLIRNDAEALCLRLPLLP
ncbi:MAG: PQQ-binding-like beta-propeller repeat protein [Planctomycetota bacterium]